LLNVDRTWGLGCLRTMAGKIDELKITGSGVYDLSGEVVG